MKRASLNHTFRVIWSEVTKTWVAVSEIVHGRGKGRGKSKAVARARGKVKAIAIAVAAALLLPAGTLYAQTHTTSSPAAVITVNPIAGGYRVTETGVTPTTDVSPNNPRARVSGAAVVYTGMNPFTGSITVDPNARVYVGGAAIPLATIEAAAIRINDHLSGIISNRGVLDVLAGAVGDYNARAAGIMVFNVEVAGALTNSGAIMVTATVTGAGGDAYAFGIDTGTIKGSLTNSGNIEVTANSNYISIAYGLEVMGIDSALTNSGNIEVTATASGTEGDAGALGVFTYHIADEAILTNSGTITATATANLLNEWGGTAASGVMTFDIDGELTNSGTITATAEARTGEVSAAGIGTEVIGGELTNSGTITATATNSGDGLANATGVGVSTIATNGVLRNAAGGTITATATASGADGIARGVGVLVGGAASHNGSILNSGTIHGSHYSLWIDAGTGTVTNNAGGRLIGDLQVGSKGAFTNHGQLVLKSGVDLNNVRDTGLPTQGFIQGNYIQGPTGVLHIAAHGAGKGQYSQLLVAGSVTLQPGATAFVDVKQVNTLAAGQTLEGVVQSQSPTTLSGNFASVSDNSALLRFASVPYGQNRIDFNVEQDRRAADITHEQNNPAAAGAAGIFDLLFADLGEYPDMQPILEALYRLETEQEVSNALSQILPPLQGGTSTVAMGFMQAVSNIIQAQQGGQFGRASGNRFHLPMIASVARGQSDLASGDRFRGDRSIWLRPMGSWADQRNRYGYFGYEARSYGFVLGADVMVFQNQRLGVAFSYSDGRVDGNNAAAPQRVNVDNYQFIIYGSNSLSDATEVNYQLGLGHHTSQGRRVINFGGQNLLAQFRFNSNSFHAGAGVAHTVNLSAQTDFTPSVRVDYRTVLDRGYTETGAGALNLVVDANRAENLRLGADARLSFRASDTTTLVANAGLSYDAINERPGVVAAFAGAPGLSFTTHGIRPSALALNVGAGVVYQVKDGLQLAGHLDLESRSGFTNTTGSMNLRWNW